MVEFFEFPKKNNIEKPVVINQTETKPNLFFKLSDKAKSMIISLLKRNNESEYKFSYNSYNQTLQDQRDLVRNWENDQVINFIENEKNEKTLEDKPALVVALYEKITEKI